MEYANFKSAKNTNAYLKANWPEFPGVKIVQYIGDNIFHSNTLRMLVHCRFDIDKELEEVDKKEKNRTKKSAHQPEVEETVDTTGMY